MGVLQMNRYKVKGYIYCRFNYEVWGDNIQEAFQKTHEHMEKNYKTIIDKDSFSQNLGIQVDYVSNITEARDYGIVDFGDGVKGALSTAVYPLLEGQDNENK